MTHIAGPDALKYAQFVRKVDDDQNFAISIPAGRNFNASVLRSKLPFSSLTDGDTIVYRATSLDDPSKFEIGIGTVENSTANAETLDRSDANVLFGSAGAGVTVDFRRADGSAGDVLVEGVAFPASNYTFAITNWVSDVAMNCNTAADAELADVIGTVVKALIEVGILRGSVTA